ncbi:MAG: GGDEF domain-containing protein [Shinella sp.]|nr:GGDEF domain-containing protein [Shinella sp.]
MNFFIAQCFCIFFLAISVRSRHRAAARWFAAGFAVASFSAIFEILVAYTGYTKLWAVCAFASMLAGLCFLRIGLGHLYAVRTDRWLLAVLFVAAVALDLLIYDLPRGTLQHALPYQVPFAVLLSMSAYAVWRSGARKFVDRLLAAMLALTSAHYMLKAVFAVHAGSGNTARDYIQSNYALISQSLGAILVVSVGLMLLCVLVLEIMADDRVNAEVDSLSGLLNRRGFENRVNDTIRHVFGAHCLVVCDLDHFKAVNDTYGHQGGDAAIRLFGELLSSGAQDVVVGRIGGEEFAVFLRNASVSAAVLFAQRIRSQLAASAIPGLPPTQRITSSFGVAGLDRGETLWSAMRRADAALYAAKKAGRDCIRQAEAQPADIESAGTTFRSIA